MAGAPPQVEHNVWEGGPVAWLLVPAAVQQRSVGCQTLWGWGVARQPLRWRHIQPAALDDPTGLLQASGLGRGEAGQQGGNGEWELIPKLVMHHTQAHGTHCMQTQRSCPGQSKTYLPGVEASR